MGNNKDILLDAVWDCYNCRSVMVDRKPDLLPHTEKLWTHLESNLVSAELDPKLVSKLDSLRTQADKQRYVYIVIMKSFL